MVTKLLPFFRRRTARGRKEGSETPKTCEEEPAVVETKPPRLLNEQDVQSNWLPDDLEQRIAFMQALADHSLPMPQNEGQFHAARVFSDTTGRSEYNIEQWVDYLRLQGYSVQETETLVALSV
mmetsp:Transcript_34162/g.54726  ORF Transcript_34162/g.54726 Transcript_34162/m.54726 type:complete len:123 (-) Transcript_34162:234-602(-)